MNAVKWNPEFRLNGRTDSTQFDVDFTTLKDGNFLATWTDSSSLGPDTNGGSIRAQIFRGDGSRVGSEFQVNANAPGPQAEHSVTTLANGNFVVTWQTSAGGGGTTVLDIRAQVFDPTGARVGAEFFANTGNNSNQLRPTVAALSDGRFVAFWESGENGVVLGLTDIVGQIFNADGSKSGGEFFAYQTARAEPQRFTSVEALDNGRFVVSWTDGSTSAPSVRAQVYNANGTTAGPELSFSTSAAASTTESDIASFGDGRFVAIWTDIGAPGSQVRARVYNANGTASTGEFVVNSSTAGRQLGATVEVLKDGRFIVAWSAEGADRTIKAQIYDANGTKSGPEFKVPTNPSLAQSDPSITVLDDGRFVIGWRDSSGGGGSDKSGGSVQAQIFDVRTAAVSLNGTTGDDTYFGTRFADRIAGQSGDDYIYAERGNDRIVGNAGADTLKGGNGNDILNGGSGADWLVGGTGFDIASYSSAASGVRVYLDKSGTNTGDAAGDKFSSIEGVVGSAFRDTIKGNSGGNVLNGGEGNDVLIGSGGKDRLTGGDGADRFHYDAVADAGDTIFSFDSSDTISFTGTAFGNLTPGRLSPDAFRSNSTGIALDRNDRFIFENDTGELYFDSNGSATGGVKALVATIEGGFSLLHVDILIV